MAPKHATANCSLDIMTININGISEACRCLLSEYISTAKVAVAAITETKKPTLPDNYFDGFRTFHKNNSNNPGKQGGTAIAVSDSFQATEVPGFSAANIDETWVILQLLGKTILFGCVYVNPNNSWEEDCLIKCMSKAKMFMQKYSCHDMILMGDFNARHPQWGDRKINPIGRKLAEFVTVENLIVLNDGQYTFTSTEEGGSVIDLCIVTTGIAHMNPTIHIDYDTELLSGAPNRGHYPVFFTFTTLEPTIRDNVVTKLDWPNANWNMWNELVEEEVYLQRHLWESAEMRSSDLWKLTKVILAKGNQAAIPKKKTTKHSKPYWNASLTHLSSTLRQKRKQFKACSDPIRRQALKEAKDNFSCEVEKARANWLEIQCSTLNHLNGRKFWSTYKQLFNNPSQPRLGVLLDQGSLVSDLPKKPTFSSEIFSLVNI